MTRDLCARRAGIALQATFENVRDFVQEIKYWNLRKLNNLCVDTLNTQVLHTACVAGGIYSGRTALFCSGGTGDTTSYLHSYALHERDFPHHLHDMPQ